MTNIKITSLPSTSAAASTDIIPIVDLTGPTTKRITVANLFASAVSPGSNTHVLFNDSGSIGGNSGLTFNKVTGVLTVSGTVSATSGTITALTTVSSSFWSVASQNLYLSGSSRIFINPLLGDKVIMAVDSGGSDYPVITVNGSSAVTTFGNYSFQTYINGYGLFIAGAATGVQVFDGRNSLTTDTAVVSQRLNSTFFSLSGSSTANGLTGAQVITGIGFSVNASEIWEFEFIGTFRPTNAAGARFAVMAPTGSNVDAVITSIGANTSSLVQGILFAGNTLSTQGFGLTAGAHSPVRIVGTVKVGSSAGTINIGTAPATLASNALSVASGSYFKARRADSV